MFRGMTRSEWFNRVSVDFEKGEVYWKSKTEIEQPDARIRNSWNSKWSGKLVGTISESKGKKYMSSVINGKGYKLHQLIYFLSGGYIENGLVIDHINGDSLDNRLSNLRAVTQAENNRNVKICRKDSVTGVKGIYYNASYKKSKKKFAVKVHHHEKQYLLGRYESLQAAYNILVNFKKEHGLPIPEYPKISDSNPMVTAPPNSI